MYLFKSIANQMSVATSQALNCLHWMVDKSFEIYNQYQSAHPAAKAYAHRAVKERFKEGAEIGVVAAGVGAALANPEIGVPALMAAAVTALEQKESRDLFKQAVLFPAKCLHDKRNYDFLAGVPTESDLVSDAVTVDDLDFVRLSHKR